MWDDNGVINKCLKGFTHKIIRGIVHIVRKFIFKEISQKGISGLNV